MNSVGTDKWQHVPSRKGNRRANHSDMAEGYKTAGLSHSSAPFSRYSQKKMEEDMELESTSLSSSSDTSKTSLSSSPVKAAPSKEQRSASGIGKRSSIASSKKAKQKKLTLEECLSELDAENITELANCLHGNTSDHLGGLKEVQTYLQSVLGKAEQENDYTFSTKPPGYPLTLVPQEIRESLLEAIRECPPLAQEKAFVYCIDRLLSDLGAGSSTWATRIMMLLLIKSNYSVCLEAVRIIKIHLQSNISKVPEALSLLWAGMPHPHFHLSTAIRTWPEHCLPLFQQTNIPRQVFSYALQYTAMLISFLGGKEKKDLLLDLINPKAMCALLSSHQLHTKRLQKNVQDFLGNIPDIVINSCSEAQLADYFKEMFKPLTGENNSLLLSFCMACLNRSGKSWEVWPSICSSSPDSSSVLLHELLEVGSIEILPLPVDEWAKVMAKLSHRIPSKDRPLVKTLVASNCADIEESRIEVKKNVEQSGRWCSGCGLLVILFSGIYLVVLFYILYQISTQGPGAALERIVGVLDPKWVEDAWRVLAVVLDRLCSTVVQ